MYGLPALETEAKETDVVARPLTERQQAILDFIVEARRAQGFPPTLREIGTAFQIRSTKGVNDHLAALERKGKIRRQRGSSRGIEVIEVLPDLSEVVLVPLVGRIAAGTPLLATENVEQTFSLDRALAPHPDLFLLRVQGESMVEAHICDGDLILVRRQDAADEGEIVVALVDDEATVKRFFRDGDRIRLQPENATMRPIMIDPSETPVRILGKVVGVYRTL